MTSWTASILTFGQMNTLYLRLQSAVHLPDPLPELGAVPGAAHPQQQVPELRHEQVQLQQRLAPADIDIMSRCTVHNTEVQV